ncbi:hypothetical protein GOZ97_15330 [Agrobacterium vitis]|uniref:hypothetical protein n=1 Tax=Rhizobium/Agrobacterium group TaxID=227290 RepID=UPI0008DBEBE2|nr:MULTISPECIES: hypothetical protein [Rhizobium/Agrobacterium group]MCF1433534.1 hypothetical protein [Allorhizobium ampelinum]MUO90767.1 hypothetical protein [Agrobacterium vitis]MUZ54129.1 hypothetical protein [Agrobacterium vitis]MUZ92803.1 hypothetical protein [Agrobacterium vitis]MVA40562.1 hypothetical protein [Agrobacterium vitis]
MKKGIWQYTVPKAIISFLTYIFLCSQALAAEQENELCNAMAEVDRANCKASLELLMSGGPKPYKPSVFVRAKDGKWAFRYEMTQASEAEPFCILLMNHLVLRQDRSTLLQYTSYDDMLDFDIPELDIHETAIPGRLGEIFVDVTRRPPTVELPMETKDNVNAGIRVEILQPTAYAEWERKAVKQDCKTID